MRLFGVLLNQENAFFDVNSSGELTSRLTSDVQARKPLVRMSELSFLFLLLFLFYASQIALKGDEQRFDMGISLHN